MTTTIAAELTAALRAINPAWSAETGRWAGSYHIFLGLDEDGDQIEADCPDDIIVEHFPVIIDMSTEGFRNVTYRISPRLTLTIDDNANHFSLSEKTDDQVIADLKAAYA
jgi:hypothetical protein